MNILSARYIFKYAWYAPVQYVDHSLPYMKPNLYIIHDLHLICDLKSDL